MYIHPYVYPLINKIYILYIHIILFLLLAQ